MGDQRRLLTCKKFNPHDMKPQRFKPGQEVTPTLAGFKVVSGPVTSVRLPQFGNIYHVSGYEPSRTNYSEWCIFLTETGTNVSHDERYFTPVISTKELYTELEECLQTETAKP